MYNLLKENVYQLIREKGYSVRKVERDCGIAYSTIQYWDVHMPSIDKVERVAKYFGVTVDYLLGNETDPADIDDLRFLHDNPDAHLLLKNLKDMPKSTIAKLTEIAKVLNENGSL